MHAGGRSITTTRTCAAELVGHGLPEGRCRVQVQQLDHIGRVLVLAVEPDVFGLEVPVSMCDVSEADRDL